MSSCSSKSAFSRRSAQSLCPKGIEKFVGPHRSSGKPMRTAHRPLCQVLTRKVLPFVDGTGHCRYELQELGRSLKALLRIFLEKRCDKADDRIVCLDLRIGADQSARTVAGLRASSRSSEVGMTRRASRWLARSAGSESSGISRRVMKLAARRSVRQGRPLGEKIGSR